MGENAIDSFWGWWRANGAAAVNAAIEAGTPEAAVPLLSPRVASIDERLSWELGPGQRSAHQLIVTAADPAERAVARRWLNAAPPADTVWSYSDYRQRRTLGMFTITVGSSRIHYCDVIVGVQRMHAHLDVQVYHPSFADAPQRQRLEVAFIVLDHALGELDVEKWIGGVDVVTHRPVDGYPLAELVGVVDALAAENTLHDGSPAWAAMQWDGEDGPVVANAQVPLCAAAAPNLDTHCALQVPYSVVDETGFPTDHTWDALADLHEVLDSTLGSSGRVVARETIAGTTTMHVYLDSSAVDADVLTAIASTWTQAPASATCEHDPGWVAVAHLRA
ncbi:DUF695 domain-containing protein [Mycolicibacterium sp. Y3]